MQCLVLIQIFLNILIAYVVQSVVFFASRNKYELVLSQTKKYLNFSWGIWYMVKIWLNKSLKVLVFTLIFFIWIKLCARNIYVVTYYERVEVAHKLKKAIKKIFQIWNKYPFTAFKANVMLHVARFVIPYDHNILVTSLSKWFFK